MLKLFGRFKAADWILIVLLVGILICGVYFDVTIPDYTQSILNAAFTGGDVLGEGWPMILYSVGSMVCTISAAYIAARLGTNLSKYLRFEMFQTVQKFGFNELNKYGTPSLITRSTNDIEQVQMAMVFLLRMGVSAPTTAIWAIIKINTGSTALMGVTLAWIGFLVAALIVLVTIFIPKFKLIQKFVDNINKTARQNLSGLRVVKAYAADKYEEAKFEEVIKGHAKLQKFVGRAQGLMFPLMFGVLNALVLTINWFGAHLISKNELDFATMTAFTQLATQVLFSFIMLLFVFVLVPRAIVSARRINEVRDTKISIQDPANPKEFVPSAAIEFKNVSFQYEGAESPTLKNLNFKVNEGETVAFIGSTGSGKSTVINLVPRFYDATEGEVLIGGVNVKDVRQEDILKSIGYVPQKGNLFSGTVADNIGFGLTNEEIEDIRTKKDGESVPKIEEIAKVASAHDFISAMSEGYDSEIAQGGKNVSGGQRQRLSIARAVALDPKIFIFDDSFSALDYKTDRAVRQALKERGKGATNLIVAQRVGSIMEADKIIVMNEGEIIGMGTHKELMKSCEVYQEIAFSQLSKEELGVA